jgi:hypothetical protein
VSEEPSGARDPQWLLEPPPAGEIRFSFAVGEGAQLTAEMLEALDGLLVALDMEPMGDVRGHSAGMACGSNCGNYCNLGFCLIKGYEARFDGGIFELQGRLAVNPPPGLGGTTIG